MIEDNKPLPVKFELKESGDIVKLYTPYIQAKVLLTTGEARFEDKHGNPILLENCGEMLQLLLQTMAARPAWKISNQVTV